jgi:hypothetical protein
MSATLLMVGSAMNGALLAQSVAGVGTPLVHILLTVVVVGILLWLVNRFIPMQSTIKGILNGIVVIILVLWLLQVFGLFSTLSNIRVGH